jgi:hypothetical protein
MPPKSRGIPATRKRKSKAQKPACGQKSAREPQSLKFALIQIDALTARIATLEQRLAEKGASYLDIVGPADDEFFNKQRVARRYGWSVRTVDRHAQMDLLPPPDIINGRIGWWLSTLQKFDRERVRERGGAAAVERLAAGKKARAAARPAT